MVRKKIVVDEKKCSGCRACEFACAFQQKKAFHYNFSLIRISNNREHEGFFIPALCRHCEDPPCASECPPTAITRDDNSGIVSIDHEKCDGCGICVEACPWAVPNIALEKNLAKICDLCRGDPLCVKFCSLSALNFEIEGNGK